MKILIVGGGNMGQTYARSFLRSHITSTEELMILERSPEKAEHLKAENIGTIYGRPEDCLRPADLVILAVKPQDSLTLFSSLKPFIDPQQVFLSIMAGVKMETIGQALGSTKIIRAMPNLASQIGMGMTVYTSTPEVTRIELVMVQNLLNSTGKSFYVETEELIDSATAISGSGPAYVFFFMQSIISAAVNMGFQQAEAELLTWQTFKGAIELFHINNFSCEDWISLVSSKGGTTEAAMESFLQNEVSRHIEEGTIAAQKRAFDLGN